MWKKFKSWCGSNTPAAKCTRTIAQGVIGVLIANADVMLGYYIFDSAYRAIIVALVMAVLSPIQAAIGDMALPDEEWEVNADA